MFTDKSNRELHQLLQVYLPNKKHFKKMLGPFTTASRLTPIHQMSLAVLSRAACASMSTTTTTRDRGDGYGPMEWAQLWWCIKCDIGYLIKTWLISYFLTLFPVSVSRAYSKKLEGILEPKKLYTNSPSGEGFGLVVIMVVVSIISDRCAPKRRASWTLPWQRHGSRGAADGQVPGCSRQCGKRVRSRACRRRWSGPCWPSSSATHGPSPCRTSCRRCRPCSRAPSRCTSLQHVPQSRAGFSWWGAWGPDHLGDCKS